MRTKIQKTSSLITILAWIKNNPIITIWLILCASALFNIGYFYPLNLKYVSFLSASDFYAGTMIYVFFMIYITLGIWAFFDFDKPNMFFLTIKFWSVFIKYKKWEHILKRAQKNNAILTSAECRQLNSLIVKVRKLKKCVQAIFKGQITISILLIINCFFVFGLCYVYCGRENCILILVLFLGLCIFDGLTKNITLLKIVKVFMIFYCIPLFGRLYLFHNVSSNAEIITTKEQKYTVIRKIESGYFVLDDCSLLFLDNNLNIKTTQKIEKGYLYKVCNNKKLKSNDSPMQSGTNH